MNDYIFCTYTIKDNEDLVKDRFKINGQMIDKNIIKMLEVEDKTSYDVLQWFEVHTSINHFCNVQYEKAQNLEELSNLVASSMDGALKYLFSYKCNQNWLEGFREQFEPLYNFNVYSTPTKRIIFTLFESTKQTYEGDLIGYICLTIKNEKNFNFDTMLEELKKVKSVLFK